MGDDITDEDAFRDSRPDWLTVRVGNSARSAADFYTPGFADVERLLKLLVEASAS
jgi:trehalose-6-phosphatase